MGELPPYTLAVSTSTGASGTVKDGFNAKTSHRIAAKSSTFSDYYQNADGSFTVNTSEAPLNYRTSTGTWAPIDATLVRGSDGRFHQAADSLGVSFSAGGSQAASSLYAHPVLGVRATVSPADTGTDTDADDLASLDIAPDETFTWGLQGAADVPAQVSGDTAEYDGILPDTDVTLLSTGAGIKETFTLASADAPDSWTFPLTLTGVSVYDDPDTGWELLDSTGSVVGRLPQPFAYDSVAFEGGHDSTYDVDYSLTTLADGGQALVMTLDASWLDDPSRVFPVTVDPTATLNETGYIASTYVLSPETNDYSSDGMLKVGYDDWDHKANSSNPIYKARSFIYFEPTNDPAGNPTDMPAGSGYHVSTASLKVFDIWAATCTAEPFDVYPITASWPITGNKSWPGPSIGPSMGSVSAAPGAACTNTLSDPNTGVSMTVPLDVSVVNQWTSTNPASYEGVALGAADETADLQWKVFDSTVVTTHPPTMSLTYTPDTAPQVSTTSPENGYNSPTLTPTLTATATDADNWPNIGFYYYFQIFDATTGDEVADSGTSASECESGASSWTVPSGKLAWGKSYSWVAFACDHDMDSAASAVSSLVTAIPPPLITSSLSQNTSGNGFDPSIGNYTTTATDADVATAGPSLEIVRDYNSLDPRTSQALGGGWSSILDSRVTEQDAPSGAVNSVTVTYPDGSEVGFGRNADGTFTAPSGRFATFTSATGGGYTLTDKNDTVYTFTESLGSGVYAITSVTDASGRAIDFTWNGPTGNAGSNEITMVTSATSGRSLTLTWASAATLASNYPHVTSITTNPVDSGVPSSGLIWKYFYSGDKLASVCDPVQSGSCTGAGTDASTKYSYATGTQYRTAQMDIGPADYWPLSESSAGSSNTAADVVAANESTQNGTYSTAGVTYGTAGPLAGSSSTAVTLNGTSGYVALPQKLVTGGSYISVSLWFKSATSTTTGPLFCEQNTAITATPTNATCSLYVGTDHKLHGAWWNGSSNYVMTSTATVDDGLWHHVVLSGAGTTQQMYLDGTASKVTVAPLSGQINNGVQYYDYVGGGYASGYWADTPPAGYWYFAGSISDVAVYDQPVSAAYAASLYGAGTTPTALLTGIIRPRAASNASEAPGAQIQYSTVTDRVTEVTDASGHHWQVGAPVVSGSAAPYKSAVLGADPSGYWRLGDAPGSASAYDEVNDGSGTYNNVTLGVGGPLNSAQKGAGFDGATSYLQVPAPWLTGASTATISLWFKTTGTTQVLFDSQNDTIANGTSVYMPGLYVGADGKLLGEWWNGSGTSPMESTTAVNDGKWHQVVLSGSGSTQSLYLDGKQVGSPKTGTIDVTGSDEYIGAGVIGGGWPDESNIGNTGTVHYFQGSIAEVSLYRTALTDGDVAAQYQAAMNSKQLNPVSTVYVTDPTATQVQFPFDGTSYNASANKTWTGASTHLTFQPDGDLVVYRNSDNKLLWNSATGGHATPNSITLTFATSGDMVIANGSTVLWSAKTISVPGNTATLEADGDFVVDDVAGNQLWEAKTTVPGAAGVLIYQYDVLNGGRMLAQTDGTGATTTYGYDSSGYVHTVTDADGDVTTTGHDARGNVVSTTTCQVQSTDICSTDYSTYYPDDTTAVLASADPRNDLQLTSSDGRSSSSTDTAYQTSYTYDAAGDRTGVTTPPVVGFPYGRTTTTTYSDGTGAFPAADSGNVPTGLPVMVVDPAGAVTRTAYYHDGDVAATEDAEGQVTEYTYDGVGRIKTKTEQPGKPVGQWQLNQTTGTSVPDTSGAGNGATAANVSWTGGVGVFNGTSSAVTASSPVLDSASSFSISAWVDLSSIPSGQADVVTLPGANQYAAFLQYSNYSSSWSFGMTSADVPYSGPAPSYYVAAASGTPATGTWTHLVAVYDATAKRNHLYINGTLVATSPTVATSWTATQGMTIGSGTGQYFFNGSIADVQAYQRALSTSDISTLYADGHTSTSYVNTTPAGLVTSYQYDGLGHTLQETDPAVTDRVTGAVHTAVTTTTYDADSNATAVEVSDTTGGDAPRITTTMYNNYDEVASTTDPQANAGASNGSTKTFTYDTYGNETSQTDQAGDVTNMTYDADNRLLTESLHNYIGDPVNPSAPTVLTVVSKAYDPAGRLASTVDAVGNTTCYQYTDNGLTAKVTVEPPNTSCSSGGGFVNESDSYDAAGNAIQKVTANGSLTTNYTVDAADRPIQTVADPGGAARTTTVSYTPDDQIATQSQTDSSGQSRTTKFTYDAMGNELSQSVDVAGSGGPIAWWGLDQTQGGSVTDESGTGNTAQASNVTWTGSGASFDGTDSSISTNGSVIDTSGTYTLSAWVDPAAQNTSVFTEKTSGTSSDLGLGVVDNTWYFSLGNSGSPLIPHEAINGGTAADGVWAYVAVSYDSTTGLMSLYVDGASVATGTFNWGNVEPSGETLALGAGQNVPLIGPQSYFSGQISNFQAYQRALSPSEISTLYAAGRESGTTASSPWQTTSWTRDVRGLATSMTDPNGNTTSYAYDEAGHLTITTDPPVTSTIYNQPQVPTEPTASAGYNTFGEQVEAVDPDGNESTVVYDADGRQVTQTSPPYTAPGASSPTYSTMEWTYNNIGETSSVSDGLNRTTSYVYDQIGDTAQTTAPGNRVTHTTYYPNGQPHSVTDPTGATTQNTYDLLGRQLDSTTLERYPNPVSLTTTYSYAASATNPDGANLASETSPAGVVTNYGYDNLGEAISESDASGHQMKTQYDYLGEPVTVTEPDQSYTQTTYNAAQEPTSVATYDPSRTQLTTTSATYDADGNVLSTTDARQHTTTFTYDATGLLTQEVQPVSASSSITTSFGYDPDGHQTLYTDGSQNNWYTTYSTWGQPSAQVEPTAGTYTSAADSTTTYAYDADGEPSTETLPGGITQSFSYYDAGDLHTETGSGAASATATRTFGYDLDGRMTSAATSNTATTGSNATSEAFSYDDRGDLLGATGSAGTSSFTYNGDGKPLNSTNAAGTATYVYNSLGQLYTATDPETGTTLTYTYNNMGELSNISYGSGQDAESLDYTPEHELKTDTLTSGSGGTVASIGYTYDLNGNLNGKTTSGFTTSATNSYVYDDANRLTSWTSGSTTTAYSYDPRGNRTQVGPNVYTYNARNELTSDGVNSYSYTASGNLSSETTTSGAQSYTSDAYGQEITANASGYGYDALGRVITDTASGGTAATMQYDGAANLVASDGAFAYSRNADGSLLGVNAVGGTTSTGQLALTDQHTDVVGTFTAGGSALSGSATYDPMGNVIGAVTKLGNLGYQSEFTDSATGQVNMAARWYNPATGQFTAKDTAQNAAAPNSVQANPFAYGDDDPMGATDPSGHMPYINYDGHTIIGSTQAIAHQVQDDDYLHWVSKKLPHATTDEIWQAVSEFRRIQTDGNTVQDAYATPAPPGTGHMLVGPGGFIGSLTAQGIQDAQTQLTADQGDLDDLINQFMQDDSKQACSNNPLTWGGCAHNAAVWVNNHPLVKEIVTTAVGIVATAGCLAGTAGAGSVGCAALGGAAASGLNYVITADATGNGSVLGLLTAMGVGAAAGYIGGAVAEGVSGAVASAVDSALGDGLSSSVVSGSIDGMIGGAAGGAVQGGGDYLLECGSKCSWSGMAGATAMGAATGAAGGTVFGGALGGGSSLGGDVGDASGAGDAGDAGADVSSGDAGGSGDPVAEEESEGNGACEVPHSFTGQTQVLMADGSTKSIDQVKVGDEIANSVPGQSTVQDHAVTNVIVTKTDHDFVDLGIAPVGTGTGAASSEAVSATSDAVGESSAAPDGVRSVIRDGIAGASAQMTGKLSMLKRSAVGLAAGLALVAGSQAVVHGSDGSSAAKPAASDVMVNGEADTATSLLDTTFHHPFYDITQSAFVEAQYLKVGDRLQTTTGQAAVTSVRLYHANTTTYDLTIGSLHTYYVVAGNTPVLVHNINGPTGECGPPGTAPRQGYTSAPFNPGDPYSPESVRANSEANQKLYAPSTADQAAELGYGQRIPPQKAPFDSHKQDVFTDGKNYISRDIDGHNVSNGWKVFNRRGQRIGTYDGNLNYLKG